MAPITIRNYYPHRFELEPELTDEPQAIDLRIARFTVEQGKAFARDYARIQNPPSGRMLYRKPDSDEQARHPSATIGEGKYVIDDVEIRRRRLVEMTVEDRDKFLELEAADADFEYQFLVGVVSQFITVAPGQSVLFEAETEADTIEVKSGADLVKVFGGNRPVMVRLAVAVWGENHLSADQKKGWRKLFTSRSTSSEPAKILPGPRPAAIAEPVALEGSASAADATAPSEPIPSGSITI